MTARAKRVVWTVPGAASDRPGSATEQLVPWFSVFLSSFVLEHTEGER